MSDACDRAKLARRNGSKKCLIQCGTAEAGYEAELPATVLNRSPIIKEAVCIADGTPRLVLPFSAEFYRAWLDHVSASSRCAPIPTDTAVKGLQARLFFAVLSFCLLTCLSMCISLEALDRQLFVSCVTSRLCSNSVAKEKKILLSYSIRVLLVLGQQL